MNVFLRESYLIKSLISGLELIKNFRVSCLAEKISHVIGQTAAEGAAAAEALQQLLILSMSPEKNLGMSNESFLGVTNESEL